MSAPSNRATPASPSTAGTSRRAVLKGTAAAGVAALVWAEPTIKGLARRPAYAATGSTTENFFITITGTVTGTAISDLMATKDGDGAPVAVAVGDDGLNHPTISLTATGETFAGAGLADPFDIDVLDTDNALPNTTTIRLEEELSAVSFTIFTEIICTPQT